MTKQILLPSDAAAATPSLRTLGTGATQAAAGNAAPNAHASAHANGGSDPLAILGNQSANTVLAGPTSGSAAAPTNRVLVATDLSGIPGPSANGWLAQTTQIEGCTGTFTPGAGFPILAKIMTGGAFTINTITFWCLRAGTGVTPLANCFIGIYDSTGTRQFVSADQSSAWASGGNAYKTVTVSGGYTVTANSYIYIAILIGTQATTTFQIASTATTPAGMVPGGNLAADHGRFGSCGSSASSLANPATLSTLTTNQSTIAFFAVY